MPTSLDAMYGDTCRANGYYFTATTFLYPQIDYGYSTTVPYTIDITSDFSTNSSMSTWLVNIRAVGNHAVYNYSTSVYVRSYRTTKIWSNLVTYTPSTSTFAIPSSTAIQSYASSTNWAAGAGNAGFCRLLAGVGYINLNGYEASAAFVDNGTQYCLTSINVNYTIMGLYTPGISVPDRRPYFSVPHSPLEPPANFVGVPPGAPPPPGQPPGQPPGKIICTAMNNRYGFGSFRNHVWLAYAKEHLKPEHEKGYHALFGLLVKIAYKSGDGYFNKIVRASLEEIVTRRTKDIWQEKRGKTRDWRGRIYRMIFEPACYIVGKLLTITKSQ